MDTSEQYLKMCEKAKEIQALRPFENYLKYEDGDVLFAHWADGTSYPVEKRKRRIGIYTFLGNNPNQYSKSIWLPKQDQLQEMIDGDMPYKLGGFFRQLLLGLAQGLISMEQLWLAFVQKELYNKVWNGEDWKVARLMPERIAP